LLLGSQANLSQHRKTKMLYSYDQIDNDTRRVYDMTDNTCFVVAKVYLNWLEQNGWNVNLSSQSKQPYLTCDDVTLIIEQQSDIDYVGRIVLDQQHVHFENKHDLESFINTATKQKSAGHTLRVLAKFADKALPEQEQVFG